MIFLAISLAKRGKTTAGWFYGFKLHLIINEVGEILAFQFTPGNVADVSTLESLSRGIFGKLFGDKGYISAKSAKKLFERGLKLFTTFRKKMKNKLILTFRNRLSRRIDFFTLTSKHAKYLISNLIHIEHPLLSA